MSEKDFFIVDLVSQHIELVSQIVEIINQPSYLITCYYPCGGSIPKSDNAEDLFQYDPGC